MEYVETGFRDRLVSATTAFQRQWRAATVRDMIPGMSDPAPAPLTTARMGTLALRHTALVRVTHWVTTDCFLGLLVSSTEILISHQRFYWEEAGNVMTPSLFDLPI